MITRAPSTAVCVFEVEAYASATGAPVTGLSSATAGLSITITATDRSQTTKTTTNLEALAGTVASPSTPTSGKFGFGEVGGGKYLVTCEYTVSKTNVAGLAQADCSDTAGDLFTVGEVYTGTVQATDGAGNTIPAASDNGAAAATAILSNTANKLAPAPSDTANAAAVATAVMVSTSSKLQTDTLPGLILTNTSNKLSPAPAASDNAAASALVILANTSNKLANAPTASENAAAAATAIMSDTSSKLETATTLGLANNSTNGFAAIKSAISSIPTNPYTGTPPSASDNAAAAATAILTNTSNKLSPAPAASDNAAATALLVLSNTSNKLAPAPAASDNAAATALLILSDTNNKLSNAPAVGTIAAAILSDTNNKLANAPAVGSIAAAILSDTSSKLQTSTLATSGALNTLSTQLADAKTFGTRGLTMIELAGAAYRLTAAAASQAPTAGSVSVDAQTVAEAMTVAATGNAAAGSVVKQLTDIKNIVQAH